MIYLKYVGVYIFKYISICTISMCTIISYLHRFVIESVTSSVGHFMFTSDIFVT